MEHLTPPGMSIEPFKRKSSCWETISNGIGKYFVIKAIFSSMFA